MEIDDSRSGSAGTRIGVGAALCVIIVLLGTLAALSVLIGYGILPPP